MVDDRKGSCLCGAITYTISGEMAKVTACHCSQCRKQTGTYYSASRLHDDQIVINDSSNSLRWYEASDDARRGFCSNCGSALFWKRNGSDHISVMVGTIDGKTGLQFGQHIFTDDKGDYYQLPDDEEKFPQSN